jgi:AraC-like DNA-binding protein
MRDTSYAGSLSATQLGPVVRCLDQLGIPKAPILRAAELEHAPFDEVFARFPVDAEHRLWAAIEEHMNDPAIGLKGGVQFARNGRHGVDLYLALHSGTARAAFANAERFARLADDWGHLEVCEHGELATVRVYRDGGLPRAHGAIDAQFAAAVTLLSDRLPGFSVRRVQLLRPRPEHTQPYLALYGVTPEFGATENAVTFDRTWLDAPLRGSDEVLGEILLQQVVALLRQTPSVHPLIARVQKVVLDGLARGAISLSIVAHATGTSPRTLRRRLSALGVSFNALIDSLRRELAGQYLRSGDESIADIAERLGFAGASAFQRAFQRWERMPPSTYRKLARDGGRERPASSDRATE